MKAKKRYFIVIGKKEPIDGACIIPEDELRDEEIHEDETVFEIEIKGEVQVKIEKTIVSKT